MAGRFLTKSRFKVGCECPSKLYFLDRSEFGSLKKDNPFLEALKKGGFQVGELAKLYFPGGKEVVTKKQDQAVAETKALMAYENAIIFEAAFKYENLLIRADVILKQGKQIHLIEVKSKSYDSSEPNGLYKKRELKKGIKEVRSEWKSYVIDVAFQKYVLKKALPGYDIKASLMLADSNSIATVDGLHQMFQLEDDVNDVKVIVKEGLTKDDLGHEILIQIPVDEAIETIYANKLEDKSFPEFVSFLSDICEKQHFVASEIGKHCRDCEFRIADDAKTKGLKSGFEHCWTISRKLVDEDFKKPFVFDIWKIGDRSEEFLKNGKVFIEQLSKEDIGAENGSSVLTTKDRQWLQVEMVKSKSNVPYFDHDGILNHMRSWKFPLHFIDFETALVAIPFHKGRRPYEQIAFQFSHHMVNDKGRVIHADQYFHSKRGQFPNFDFVRNLKLALTKDEGTIFRYSNHENTVLCQIREQIIAAKDLVPDADELIHFIEQITKNDWIGSRNMVDLCDIVMKHFYHPRTEGSNSIKHVLPAILHDSEELQKIYSQPIYGTDQFPSLNFKTWQWIQRQGDVVKDPYKLLPPVFDDLTLNDDGDDEMIADGGAAMTAYARMQFTQMSSEKFEKTKQALLRYCELDTLAMVMIYQYWESQIRKSTGSGQVA